MEIIKRLLNVVTLASALAFLLACSGWGSALLEYQKEIADQRESCRKVDEARSAFKNSQKPSDLLVKQYGGTPVFDPDEYLCKREIELEIFVYGKNDLGLSAILAVIVLIANYVFFGRITLWNRNNETPTSS
jgi:hypothetical protein